MVSAEVVIDDLRGTSARKMHDHEVPQRAGVAVANRFLASPKRTLRPFLGETWLGACCEGKRTSGQYGAAQRLYGSRARCMRSTVTGWVLFPALSRSVTFDTV